MARWILLLFCLAAGLAGCQSATTSTGDSLGTSSSSTTTSTTTTSSTTTSAGRLGPPTGPVIDAAVNPACGTELWAKKTLTDSDAVKISTRAKTLANVAALNAVSDAGAGGSSRVGAELHVYRFTGQLVEAKLEGDDDFHVVMRDSAGKTLITEYPAPVCDGHASVTATRLMRAARAAFAASCGTPSSTGFTPLHGTATVTGVGFYDRDHGQTGRDNLGGGLDAELHPIIGFAGGC